MAGYLIANYNVTNPDGYQAYLAAVGPTIQAHGGGGVDDDELRCLGHQRSHPAAANARAAARTSGPTCSRSPSRSSRAGATSSRRGFMPWNHA